MNYISSILIILTMLITSGSVINCSYMPSYLTPLKMSVKQGGKINKKKLSEIKIGQNKQEIIDLIGEPILNTSPTPDVWNYYYINRKYDQSIGDFKIIKNNIKLTFNNNSLINIEQYG